MLPCIAPFPSKFKQMDCISWDVTVRTWEVSGLNLVSDYLLCCCTLFFDLGKEYEYAERLVAWIQFKTICCAAALYFLIWADRRHIGRKEFEYAVLLTVSRLDLCHEGIFFASSLGPNVGYFVTMFLEKLRWPLHSRLIFRPNMCLLFLDWTCCNILVKWG